MTRDIIRAYENLMKYKIKNLSLIDTEIFLLKIKLCKTQKKLISILNIFIYFELNPF